MSRPAVLIADDELEIREFLAQILSENFRILFAKNGDEVVKMSRTQYPSLVLMDVIMPGVDGIEACRRIRQNPETQRVPVIMLTALNEPEQRIEAFRAGADDYLPKPFLPEELMARVNQKLERKLIEEKELRSHALYHGNLKLRLDEISLEIEGVQHELGQVEYRILNYLIKNRGEMVTREDLNNYVWGTELPSDRALDPHITSLRKKLKHSQSELKTIYGKGYTLVLRESGV